MDKDGYSAGYNDAQNGVKTESPYPWNNIYTQSYAHGWSVGNYYRHHGSDHIQTIVD